MAQPNPTSWRRRVNRFAGPVAALVGVAIVISSFLFMGSLYVWYGIVMLGLLIVLVGFLYGAYPLLTNERRYNALRREVYQFIGLVRELNASARSESGSERERVKREMLASVDRMGELAGRED